MYCTWYEFLKSRQYLFYYKYSIILSFLVGGKSSLVLCKPQARAGTTVQRYQIFLFYYKNVRIFLWGYPQNPPSRETVVPVLQKIIK